MTRLAAYEYQGRAGVAIAGDGVLYPLPGVRSIGELLSNGNGAGAGAGAGAGQQPDRGDPLQPAAVRLAAPVPVPAPAIYCVGWNYAAHFEEGRAARPDVEMPARPTLFSKATGTLAGPYDDLFSHPDLTGQLDWEVELAVVIGTGGRDIPEQTALRHVFGYTVANDVSARNLQAAYGGQWLKGKSLDQTCPMGPVLVTADELGDPQRLAITCRVNGRTVQSGSTAAMVFPVARVIAELSAGQTLVSGDIILTGTPHGVGHQRTPPEYLRAGDVLESEVDGVGTMRNRIV